MRASPESDKPALHVVPRACTEPLGSDSFAFAAGTQPMVDLPILPPMLGEYRVIGLLARGGMGGIYLGEHVRTGERVALKVLDERWSVYESLVTRLMNELEVSTLVRHEGLVRIAGAERSDDGTPYLVMEVLDGENLGGLVGRSRIELGAIAAIGAQIADAVAAMHEAGIVHCDLKPENVMVLYADGLGGWPRVKVLDFGVARFTEKVASDEIAGTPFYMAPEQWHGRAEARTDVYGLGCLLYELIAGTPPFDGSISQVLEAHCDRLPTPIGTHRTLPDVLERLVMRMIAKDPGMRPRMSEIARALADLAFAMPPGASNEQWWMRVQGIR
jgi:serine/threonine-protein kinase